MVTLSGERYLRPVPRRGSRRRSPPSLVSVFERPQGTTRGRIRNPAALILTVVVGGTIGYLILGLGVVDAVYQTVVTISTVGFREIADGQPDTAWKVFTLLLILVGAGSMLYGATSVIESIVESRISGQFWRFRMQRTIDDLSDHLILCGMGRVGRSIATFVRSVGQEVVVVDIDEERIVADESLFLARLHPERPASGLSIDEVATLRQAIIDALAAAYGVYDRARDLHWPDPPAALTTWSHPRDIKAPCPNCQTKMTAIRIRSRGTYFCSKCQV